MKRRALQGDLRRGRGRAARAGFLLMDAMITLGIALLVLMTMTVTVSKMNQAEKKLAAQRAGMRTLEGALLEMQAGGNAGGEVRVETLGDAATPGMCWVRVTLADNARATMTGMVPVTRDGGKR